MSLRCPKCPLKFATLTELTEHMRHEINSTGFQYQCSECGKAFQSPAHLKQHQWRHKEEKQFSCPDCKQEFKREDYINDHSAYHENNHLKNSNVFCVTCNKSYEEKCAFWHHERLFQCPNCDERYESPCLFTKHLTIHSEKDRFKCHQCEKSYSRLNSMTKHMKHAHAMQDHEAPRMRSSKQLRKRTANVAKIKDVDPRGNRRSTQQGSRNRGIHAGTLSEPGCHQNTKGQDPPTVELPWHR